MPSAVKLPWKLRLLFLVFRSITGLARRLNGTVNCRLINFFEPKAPPSLNPRDGVVSSDTVVDPSRKLWFRIYSPAVDGGKDDGGLPIIVYFHGGGFALGSANSGPYDDWCRVLARELRAVVVSVSYRLAPEHRCPSQYDDGFDALRFLDGNLDKLPGNADPKRCFLAGDSAGGNLAHHVAVKVGEQELFGLKLIGLIAIQPFFGGEERTESETRNARGPLLSLEDTDWYWKMFLPNGSDRDHPAANLFGPKSSVDISLVKYPAALILIGGLDLLYDWQKIYHDELKRAGKEVELVEDPDSFHGSFLFDGLPGYSMFLKEIRGFIRKRSDKEHC